MYEISVRRVYQIIGVDIIEWLDAGNIVDSRAVYTILHDFHIVLFILSWHMYIFGIEI